MIDMNYLSSADKNDENNQPQAELLNILVKYQDMRYPNFYQDVLILKHKDPQNTQQQLTATYFDMRDIVNELQIRGQHIEQGSHIFYWDYSTNAMVKCYTLTKENTFYWSKIPIQGSTATINHKPQMTLLIQSSLGESSQSSDFQQYQPLQQSHQHQHNHHQSQQNFQRVHSRETCLDIFNSIDIQQVTEYNEEDGISYSLTNKSNSVLSQQQETNNSSLTNLYIIPEITSVSEPTKNESPKIQPVRGKARERTIKQVAALLKEWKRLKSEEKISLIAAAQIMGVPKKSLEEYYLDFKTAKLLGFDFESNLEKKIGTLRKFCRKASQEESKARAKTPKQYQEEQMVKFLDVIDMQEQSTQQEQMQKAQSQKSKKISKE